MNLSRDDAERAFLARVKIIERFARKQAWRYHLSRETAEDFVSEVMAKFIEKDYERLCKFRGESSMEAFLAATVSNLAKDFAVELWGKFRVSPTAKRLGEIAVQLETLFIRDELPLDMAWEILRSRGFELTREELDDLAARLPRRVQRRFENLDGAAHVPSRDQSPDGALAQLEAARLAARAKAVMHLTIASWPREDRVLFMLRYKEGRKIVEIARMLNKPAHPLYHRAERLLAMLRTAFETAGLDAQSVMDMLTHSSPDFGWNTEES